MRLAFRRVARIRRREGMAVDYHSIVMAVSEISGWPYSQIFDACLDEEF
jgi:hypothetical protein